MRSFVPAGCLQGAEMLYEVALNPELGAVLVMLDIREWRDIRVCLSKKGQAIRT